MSTLSSCRRHSRHTRATATAPAPKQTWVSKGCPREKPILERTPSLISRRRPKKGLLGFVKLPFSPEGLVRSRQTCTRLLHGRLGHTSAVSVSVAPSARARWDFFFVCDQGHCGWAARQPLCASISQCKKSALSTFRSCFSCAWPDPVFSLFAHHSE
jgi:hypothetical protein